MRRPSNVNGMAPKAYLEIIRATIAGGERQHLPTPYYQAIEALSRTGMDIAYFPRGEPAFTAH